MTVPLVLVVEDDPDLRRLLRKQLEAMKLLVQEAGTGKAALEALRKATPALVCLDLMLPEQSGYTVCEFIRKDPVLQGVPVLVISARTLPEDRAAAEEAGASAYLVKPFGSQQLLAQVNKLLGRVPKGQMPH